MILSVADAKPRDQESARTRDLLPHSIAENASALIGFLEQYYEYLNSEGLPSKVISNITTEHDIDRVSSEYLDAIQAEIANSIPNSIALDRVSLYKKIVKYYSIRGTEQSAIVFFRIFFDEFIEIFYPKDYLFSLSAGSGAYDDEDVWKYIDRKGFASDQNKIQDGYLWQEYSYGIRSNISVGDWEKPYLKLVHPAGLFLYSELLLLVQRSNIWNNRINYDSTRPTEDLTWLNAYINPRFIDANTNSFHSPKFQPGWLSGNLRRLRLIISYLIPENLEEDFVRQILMILNLRVESDDSIRSLIRREYDTDIKFYDPTPLCEGYANLTIQQGIDGYLETNRNLFSNLSAVRGQWYEWENSSMEYDSPVTYVTPITQFVYPKADWNLASFNNDEVPDEEFYDSADAYNTSL